MIKKKIKFTSLFIVIFLLWGIFLVLPVLESNLDDNVMKSEAIEGISTSNTNFPYEYYWHQTWGVLPPYYLHATGLLVDDLGNAYVLGTPRDPEDDIILIKYNTEGTYQWEQRWGGPSDNDYALDLDFNSQNKIIVIGYTRHDELGSDKDIVMLCYSEQGILQWEKLWGTTLDDTVTSLVIDENDNIFLTGSIWDGNDHDVLLVKFDPLGNYQWHQTWGDQSDSERGMAMAMDDSGNLCITGYFYHSTAEQLLVISFDYDGNLIWYKIHGSSPNDYIGYGIIVDDEGFLYIVGRHRIYGTNNYDALLMKYNSTGDLQWSKLWDKSHFDLGYDLIFDLDGNIIITSICEFNYWDIALISYDQNGNYRWEYLYGGNGGETPSNIALDGIGNLYLLGVLNSSNLLLIKYSNEPIPPTIVLNSPLNNTIHNSGKEIIIDVLNSNLDTVLYNWDNTENQVWSPPYITELPSGNGGHNLYVYANDTLGNNISTMFQFITDDDNDHTPPSILLITPLNNTINPSGKRIELEISDINLDTVIYKWDDNTNILWEPPYNAPLPMRSGIHRLYIFANDTNNNTIIKIFQFTTEEEIGNYPPYTPYNSIGILTIVMGIFIISSIAIISGVYIKSKHEIVRDVIKEKPVSAPITQYYTPYVVVRKKEVSIFNCDRCGEKIEFPANFCFECGNKIFHQRKASYCRFCGTVILNKAKFCGECGRSV